MFVFSNLHDQLNKSIIYEYKIISICVFLLMDACRVSCLNEEIYQMSRIPVEKQVLLMSGGVPLFPEKTLAHYESFLVGILYSVVLYHAA